MIFYTLQKGNFIVSVECVSITQLTENFFLGGILCQKITFYEMMRNKKAVSCFAPELPVDDLLRVGLKSWCVRADFDSKHTPHTEPIAKGLNLIYNL